MIQNSSEVDDSSKGNVPRTQRVNLRTVHLTDPGACQLKNSPLDRPRSSRDCCMTAFCIRKGKEDRCVEPQTSCMHEYHISSKVDVTSQVDVPRTLYVDLRTVHLTDPGAPTTIDWFTFDFLQYLVKTLLLLLVKSPEVTDPKCSLWPCE